MCSGAAGKAGHAINKFRGAVNMKTAVINNEGTNPAEDFERLKTVD